MAFRTLLNIKTPVKIRNKLISSFLAGILALQIIGLACTTRVSEWILLNTPPEIYSLVYFYNGSLSEELKSQHDKLDQSTAHANLRFRKVADKSIRQPYYALYYRNRFIEKFGSYSDLGSLTTSPVREKIAGELMAGKLCVMLYLKTGEEQKDEAGWQVLQKTVETSPFKEIIAVVELNREDVDEAHFISFLLNVEEDLKRIHEPMLFGIFGKFKALEPLLAGGITGENINLMVGFLTAECSCLIKDDLPGADILFSGRWDNPKPALLNKILDENPLLAK